MKTNRLFRTHSFLTATLVAPVATLLLYTAPSALAAGPYYWDCNDGAAGFGTAQGSFAGSTTPTATSGWSTDSTGATVISGGAAVNPGTASNVNFGTATDGLGAGTVTVSGTQNIGDITFGAASGAIILGGNGPLIQGSAPAITVNNSLATINSVVRGAANGLTIGGSGTLVLNGLNGFTGKLTIGNNVNNTLKLQFNTIANVGAATGSSLGQPVTAANGLIQIGANSKTSTLEFTGASVAGSTDRQVQVGSPSGVGGATILNNNADSTYSLSFANPAFNVAVTTVAARNLTLGGTNTGNNQIQGAIINNSAGNVAVVKNGTGTWTLSGANTYSGTTAVNAGMLIGVAGGSSANSDVTVTGNPATLGVRVDDNTKQWTCKSLTTAGTAPKLAFAFSTTPSTSVAPLKITGNGTFTTTPGITLAAANLTAGTYPLIEVVGTAPSAVPTVTITGGGVGTLAVSTVSWSSGTLSVTITGSSAEPLTWNADSGTWDINTTANWQDNNAVTGKNYQEVILGDQVQFTDNSLTANATVTLNVAVVPASVTVNNSAYNYTISGTGSINGGTGLAKSGSQTLTLSTANTYSGDTTVSDGTLQLGAAGVLPDGSGKGNVSVTGTLDLNTNSEKINGLSGAGVVDTVAGGTPTLTVGGNDQTSAFSGVIKNTAGTLALTKTGSGTLTLSGTNTYTGATLISGGTLLVNGDQSTATGAVTVDATLGGTGTIGGATTVNGNLAPGASVGKLTFTGGLTLGSLAANSLKFELGANTTAGTTYDTVDTNTLNIGTLDFADFQFTDTGALAAGAYTLISSGALPTGSIGTASGTIGAFSATLSISGNNIILTVTASGSPYTNWAGGAAFDADANGDGVDNGLAWILGAANPGANALGLLPIPGESSGNLTMTFKQVNPMAPAKLFVEYSNDLGVSDSWHSVQVPDTVGTTTVSDVIFTISDTTPTQSVSMSVPASKAGAGKLFGRLRSSEN